MFSLSHGAHPSVRGEDGTVYKKARCWLIERDQEKDKGGGERKRKRKREGHQHGTPSPLRNCEELFFQQLWSPALLIFL